MNGRKKETLIQGFFNVPEGIRTPDLQFRKLLLYPAELLSLLNYTYIFSIGQYELITKSSEFLQNNLSQDNLIKVIGKR